MTFILKTEKLQLQYLLSLSVLLQVSTVAVVVTSAVYIATPTHIIARLITASSPNQRYANTTQSSRLRRSPRSSRLC